MSILHRRDFIKAGAAAACLAGPRSMRAAWGEIPAGIWPAGTPNYKVLEIYLYGGLSPWETFYFRPSPGPAWRDTAPCASGACIADRIRALNWTCAAEAAPVNPEDTMKLGEDWAGQLVHLGPFTKPLWRSDLLNKLRVVVMQHGLPPHEAAIPYAITGLRLGRPNAASPGAPIQRREYDRIPTRALPASYNLVPMNGIPSDNLQATTAVGLHPANAKPLTIRVGEGAESLASRLLRPNMNVAADNLIEQYQAQYRDKLRFHGAGAVTRSKGFFEYETSANTVRNAPELHAILASAPLTIGTSGRCPYIEPHGPSLNIPATAIRTAAYLLTRPAAQAARYVCVVDGGLITASGGGGYDTHDRNVEDTAINLWNTLSALASVIRRPGESTAGKISLDDTLVVLNTEFGRTPVASGQGRDHWPNGYVTALIGGPATRGISGAIDDSSGSALIVGDRPHYVSATDTRAAVLAAAGVNPFADGVLAEGDLSGWLLAASREDTIRSLKSRIFEGSLS